MPRHARSLPLRRRIVALADRLPPPRDQAARALLRAVSDLVSGRQRPVPPPPDQTTPQAPSPPARARTEPANESGAPLFSPPGHYYSPIVDVRQLTGRGSDIDEAVPLPGIDLDIAAHAAIWSDWEPHVRRWVAGETSRTRRYRPDNSMFGQLSARYLAGAIGSIRPRRYVEIGSGFSSAILLDLNDEWWPDDRIELTFIDPNPERLETILRPDDHAACAIIREQVQHVEPEVFDRLQPGDVLFIDSTHVAKSGSDVLVELFDILPRLPVGVYVHVHDIPYPFDYPVRWLVQQNRSWNEAYFLRAFLMYNTRFTVHFWTDFFARFAAEHVPATSLELIGRGPTSIWLSRVAD